MSTRYAKAETRTVEKIVWPAVVQSWSVGGKTHAMCGCVKCMLPATPPLCGYKPSLTDFGVLGKPLDCNKCIAILRDPVERAKHGNYHDVNRKNE